jgi:hypothetical protein
MAGRNFLLEAQQAVAAVKAKTAASQPKPTGVAASPYYVDPNLQNAKPDTAQAALTRAQWQLYKDKFQPTEQSALDYLKDPNAAIESAATSAGGAVARTYSAEQGMTDRRLTRLGITPTAEQKADLDRNTDLSRSLAMAGAKNTARAETRGNNIDLLSGALNLGAGLSSAATSGAASAAADSNARDIASANASAAKKASVISSGMAGAGIGAGLAAATAGGMGAAAGAGWGALAGSLLPFV